MWAWCWFLLSFLYVLFYLLDREWLSSFCFYDWVIWCIWFYAFGVCLFWFVCTLFSLLFDGLIACCFTVIVLLVLFLNCFVVILRMPFWFVILLCVVWLGQFGVCLLGNLCVVFAFCCLCLHWVCLGTCFFACWWFGCFYLLV